MTIPTRPWTPLARIRAVLALDGPLAAAAVVVFQFFLVSVSFIGCLIPTLIFDAVVGWQPTHLALWLGVLSLVPLVPGSFALLQSTRLLLAEREDACAGRAFWRSFATACRSLAWAAAGVCAVGLVLAYDLALFGESDLVFILVCTAAASGIILLIAVCIASAADPTARPVALLARAGRIIIRRPHIALSWLLLTVLAVAGAMLPVVGSTLALFLPALVGAGIHLCNDALRLPLIDQTRQAS